MSPSDACWGVNVVHILEEEKKDTGQKIGHFFFCKR